MRRSDGTVERFRIEGEGMNGAFRIPYHAGGYNPGKAPRPDSTLAVIASNGMDWDHVSVHVLDEDRCPTWEEMCFIKDLFWHRNETVVQYHPAESDYVNLHPYTLHLWKPQSAAVPTPERILV